MEGSLLLFGSVVKRLRHRPFTAVTRVRFPSESYGKPVYRKAESAQAPLRLSRLLRNPDMAQWLSWLERRPVPAEVTGSSPVWVVSCFASRLRTLAHLNRMETRT